MSDYIKCPGCTKRLKRGTTKPERYRKHADCDFSQTVVREEECKSSTPPQTAPSPTASSAESPPEDAPEAAKSVTPSTPSGQPSPDASDDASTASATPALPGSSEYLESLGEKVEAQRAAVRAEVDAKLVTQFSQPTPPDYERPTLFSQPERYHLDDGSLCSGEGCEHYKDNLPTVRAFSQPAGRTSEQPQVEMAADAASIAARVKELFYAYDNRKTKDNRSAQVTMGPSEMGTPCDRRLALSLMRSLPVNPGGDGWAAFVGTCIHAGLEDMFLWADAGTGRFAVEQRLEFASVFVPKGTADLIDRVLLMVLDHKCQGRWSRNKLKTQGLSATYKVQAHVYAHGARLRGEKIEKIAIISWPRDEASLDDLYVHVEDYDPGIVKKAFERVEKIGGEVGLLVDATQEEKALAAKEFSVADDCRFCPFFLPGARSIANGCNGKR